MTRDMERMDTVCFGGEDWWYHNRGHIDMQLMRRLATLGTTLYINSIVMQKPTVGRTGASSDTILHKIARKAGSIKQGLKKTDGPFWVYSPVSLPVHHIPWLRPFNRMLLTRQVQGTMRKLDMVEPIVWVACPAACEVALRMKRFRLVYQRTDRFEEFPNVDYATVRRYDQLLKEHADLTVFVSRMLFDSEKSQCKSAFYLDHGVDYDLFASAEQDSHRPSDFPDIAGPIVGFFGGFGKHTTDVLLLERVVGLMPDVSFVFVGHSSPECETLAQMPNVYMLGQRPYETIPHYGKWFDVAIMPWQQNEWIKACNPIKLKEYLALGKPVVSRPYDELGKYADVVYEAISAEEFGVAIRRALQEDGPERIAARRHRIRDASWDCKAQTVLKKLCPSLECDFDHARDVAKV